MNIKQILGSLVTTIIKFAIVLVMVIIVYKSATAAYDYGFRLFAEEALEEAPGRDISVAIMEDKSVKEIGELLEEKGLIRDGRLFYFQEMVSSYAGMIKPGVYVLNTSMTPAQMMQIMSAEPVEEEVLEDAAESGSRESGTQEETQE